MVGVPMNTQRVSWRPNVSGSQPASRWMLTRASSVGRAAMVSTGTAFWLGQVPAMATTGLFSGLPPMEPKNGASNEKTPPSEATKR
jgi:hypothetical protein